MIRYFETKKDILTLRVRAKNGIGIITDDI